MKLKIGKERLFFLIIAIWILLSTFVAFVVDIVYTKSQNEYISPNGISFEYFFGHFSPFIFFTYQSNFMLAVGCFLIYFKFSQKHQRLYFAFVSLITITFLVYWALISWKSNTWKNPGTAIKSLTTHLINPSLGFVGLFFIRRSLVVDHRLFFKAGLYVLGYFVFALLLYFFTYGNYEAINKEGQKYSVHDGGTIYSFLNFTKPLFYKEKSVLIVVFLDILILFVAILIPFGCSYFWKWAFKIRLEKKPLFKKEKQ
ncbi:MAGa3780 family membrane protein [Mycoplasma sp. 1654_15]|uniref:MAGa3780 family membrane protein n=1 Tax=Mycoplasma sp. 1654_15 TaxID=2725994 RepID=UPI001449E13A|nr:hypothetical protein [Mycoplasma sp. 1654_15]QJB71456.1 hypothetical protein HF996_03240 [Mycoplasma sp. 1654_15]